MGPVPRAAQQAADDPVATRLRSSRTARDPPDGSDGGGPGAGHGDREPGDQPGTGPDHDERRSEYSFESGSDAGRADPVVLDQFHGPWEPAVGEEIDEAQRDGPPGGPLDPPAPEQHGGAALPGFMPPPIWDIL